MKYVSIGLLKNFIFSHLIRLREKHSWLWDWGVLAFQLQHLAMSGVHRWVLVDFDTYEEDNLVKHVGMRRSWTFENWCGKSWIVDRIPTAEVECLPINITTIDGKESFREALKTAMSWWSQPITKFQIGCQPNGVWTSNSYDCWNCLSNRLWAIPICTINLNRVFECFIDQSDSISIERTVAESKLLQRQNLRSKKHDMGAFRPEIWVVRFGIRYCQCCSPCLSNDAFRTHR